jgi:tetratricopeptide (TPR) repeat protein
MNYGAVQLFVQCARRVRVDFALDDANAPAVVRICQLVGGLPLGVELAVQWLRVLPCVQIANELQRNMDLLVAVGPDMPERHRSFRAVFRYSWNLLEAVEQRALQQVSVFRGGFGRDAARVVAGTNLSLLRSLIDKALLVHAAPDRYDLHPLVQQYAHEQLVAANEHEQTYDRYAAWYLALAQEAAPQLQGADQRAWLDRLEAEHDNLRMAMCWLLDSGGTEQMARLSSALMSFWRVRGYYGEGRRWLEALLTQGATLAPAVRARVLSGLGELVWAQGEYAYAQTLLEESLALHKTHNPAQVAAVLHRLGAIAGYQGEYEQAAALYHECLALRRAAGDGLGIAATLNNLAVTVEEQGDEAGAEHCSKKVCTCSARMGMGTARRSRSVT